MTSPKRKPRKKAWRDPHDWYCEGPEPVESLFDFLDVVGDVYDPCCGRGNITDVARARGHGIAATDLVDRGYVRLATTADFLKSWSDRATFANIIFNPPYSYQKKICENFIRKALTLAHRRVCALVPVTFLGSLERHDWFAHEQPPTQILYLSKRPSMPPGTKIAELGNQAFKNGKVNYCWLTYDLIDPTPLPPAWLPARAPTQFAV
jgi:hypothetical protein